MRQPIFGEPFQGLRMPLGALVYYKPPGHTNKPAFDHALCQGFLWGGEWTAVSNTVKST